MIENESVDSPETTGHIEETPVQTNDDALQVQAASDKMSQVESDAAINFRRLRESKEKAERERDEMARILKEMEAKKQPQPEEEDLNFQLDPDALAEGKHLSKVAKQIKKLQEEVKVYKQQSAESIIEARIKSQYPDFDSVVNQENLAQLRENFPELANTINSSGDLYSKAVSAYTLIKKFGIQPDSSYDADKERAQRNAAKPKPLTSIAPQQGDTPLSRANVFAQGLTDDLKKQLHKEMMESMKNR